jgi:hypothetical protein
MNKLRSGSIVRPDVREDGFVRTSNVTKFLAACSSYGLPDEDLFQRDDLIEASSESLARVARTVVALIKFVEAPLVERSRYISGQGQGKKPSGLTLSNPYSQGGSASRASASTPNLLQSHGSASPTPTSPIRKRYSPPSGLPTLRSDSPDVLPGKIDMDDHSDDEDGDNVGEVKAIPVPHILAPPPKSPLRARTPKHVDDGGLFTWAKNAASPPRTYVADSSRSPMGESESNIARQSVASSAMTETTMITDISSILDFSRKRTNSSGYNKFGTIRTITTDVTSEAPSMTRTEGSAIADELARKASADVGGKYHRDRKVSEGPMVDLSRVVEEADESASSSRSGARDKGKPRHLENEKVVSKPEKPAVHLRKGKWPDDFMDAFQSHSPTRAITPKSLTPEQEDRSSSSTPISISPPRKLAIVGATRRNESLEAMPQFPRRPTHRARHSIDAPILIPKESLLGRDSSPDGIPTTSGRVMLRRHSTKPGAAQRNGVYLPRNDEEPRDSGEDSPVPFPRTSSGEHGAGSSSPHSANGGDPSVFNERPRVPRGRFQSDIDSSARRRARPSSYDELGAKPTRSRFESMVNLGVASGNASASDLLSRDSMDGSAVRKTLILREEGKPPTHFVSSKNYFVSYIDCVNLVIAIGQLHRSRPIWISLSSS